MRPAFFALSVLLALVLAGFTEAASFSRFRSPFSRCSFDPSGLGLCVVLDENVFSALERLDFGSRVEFSSFPTGLNTRVSMSLTRFTASEHGEDKDLVVLLRGGVFDDQSSMNLARDPFVMAPGSTAFLALSRHGSNGFVELENLTFFLSTPSESVGGERPELDDYVGRLAKAADLSLGTEWRRSTFGGRASVISEKSHLVSSPGFQPSELVFPPKDVMEETSARIAASGKNIQKVRRTYRVASDIDYEMFVAKGRSQSATESYYYSLVGSASAIFVRDIGSDIVSSYVRVYTTPDPYPNTASACLTYMRSTWSTTTPSRSFATLISAKSLGGGIAYYRTLCNLGYAYGVNGNMVGYFPIPVQNYHTQNWDIYVWLHETGHIWGGSHTHELRPPADTCGSVSGCAATPGSILSYCHTCTGGMTNIYLQFHQYSKNEMLPFVGSVAC